MTTEEHVDDRVFRVFIGELARQCKFLQLATKGISDVVRKMRADQPFDSDDLWYSIQGFLVCAGNISKLLWPPRTGDAQRGRLLRDLLQVPEDSPLTVRTFRNHFEHFDERLDEWARKTVLQNFADSNIGPLEQFRGFSNAPDFHRHYDPETFTLRFRGEACDLKSIVLSINDLLHSIDTSPYGSHSEKHT